ncbi:MAG: hypothetical protein IT352_04050 [Gemmatimonadales bacterium]|nr:hypothetical protein [Gemmatimonadales bacterium]
MTPSATGGVLASIAVVLSGLIGWIVINPTLAFRASELFWRVVSFFFHAADRRHAAAAVQGKASQFINNHVFSRLSDLPSVRLEVQWIETASEARQIADGDIIVRMRRDRDQTRNILGAVRVTLPQILYPGARPYLDPVLTNAMDLELLRILADVLGDHASRVFHADILTPEVQGDAILIDLLGRLESINESGLFQAVLLQEFVRLGTRAQRDQPRSDLRGEAHKFVDFVYHLATRAPGDETHPLEFAGKYFRVAFILLSKSVTAARGPGPYQRALDVNLARGLESIYLLGLTPHQAALCSEIEARLDDDPRVSKQKHLQVLVENGDETYRVPLVHYVRNELHLPPGTFADRVAELGVTVGSTVTGVVRSVDAAKAIVDLDGLAGEIPAGEVAWGYVGPLEDRVSPYREIRCTVLEIVEQKGFLRLSVKRLFPSPWMDGRAPVVGTSQRFRVTHVRDDDLCLVLLDRESGSETICGRMSMTDWSWVPMNDGDNPPPTVGTEAEGIVIGATADADDVVLSRCELAVPDFASATKKYPKGHMTVARVSKVEYNGITFEIEPGVPGRVDRFEVRKLGHELLDFERNVVVGQSFEVIVTGFKKNRRYFTLALARKAPVG